MIGSVGLHLRIGDIDKPGAQTELFSAHVVLNPYGHKNMPTRLKSKCYIKKLGQAYCPVIFNAECKLDDLDKYICLGITRLA